MNGVTRFLSRRDKRLKPQSSHHKDLFKIFHLEEKKRFSREDDKNIQEISHRLDEIEIPHVKESHIKYALQHPYSKGDPDRALELLRLFNDTLQGKIVKYNPNIPSLGAENRNMVTCYIDSLLFAMFARMNSFESILSVEFEDSATNTLAILLRFWVNMLRTGKLITVDIVKHIQEALADCGWEDARLIRQQDVSEAFTFITDKLALPLLTLKMDVYHTGKESMDDHRLVRERLLDVAIPEEASTEGTSVKLEDCLENFFNNKIEVKRLLQRRNTVTARPRTVSETNRSQVVERIEHRPYSTTEEPLFRRRTTELLNPSTRQVKEHKDDMDVSYGLKDRYKDAVRKEVLIPAWQFFHLIPWFQAKPTVEGQQLDTDAQIAAHFSKRRPVLGICLKRYKHTQDGPKRVDTYIDIPLEIRLPHFISDGTEDDGFGSSFSTFKLSLQSVICHRGNSLNAGHYISIVRTSPHEVRAPENESERKFQWLMFDDLAKDRVTQVDVRKALKSECPYLLFYQVQPVENDDEEEERSGASSSDLDEPPSYEEVINTNTSSSVPSTNTTIETSQNAIPSHTPATSVSQASSIIVVDRDDSVTPLANTPQPPPSVPSLVTGSKDISGPPRTSLEHIKSAPPALTADFQRPHSLDLPITTKPYSLAIPSGRASHDSTEKRSSVAFTDSIYINSATATPQEYVSSSDKGGYLEAKDLPVSGTTPSGTAGSDKKGSVWRRDESKERSGRRSSRTSWLIVGSINKRTRPKSMPPHENRTTMSDFVKGLKGAISKDKLTGSAVATNDGPETGPAPVSTKDNESLVVVDTDATTTTTPNTKEKGKNRLSRRKSLRPRSKGKMHLTGGEEDGEDRQCSVM